MVSARALPLTGGIETHIDEVSRRLVDRGVGVTVLTTDRTGQLPSREVVEGVKIERYRAWPANRDYYFSPSLVRSLTPQRFDLAHIQGVHTVTPPHALYAATRRGLPTALTFHTGGSSSSFRRMVRRPQWLALGPAVRAADSLIAVCEYEVDYFSQVLGLPRTRFDLVRNGSDPLPVDPTPPSPASGSPLILSIGRLEKYKGHHRVIGSMAEVRKRRPDARLVVVGSGPYEAALRKQVSDLDADDAISFTTFRSDERGALGAMVNSSDVVALLSDYEAHPVAIMEALALGVPAVVSDNSGLAELGRYGIATTIDPLASAADVAHAIVSTASEPPSPSGSFRLQTWDSCVDQLLALYQRMWQCAS